MENVSQKKKKGVGRIKWKKAKETSKHKKTEAEIENEIQKMTKQDLINSISGILDFLKNGTIKDKLGTLSVEDLKILYRIINKNYGNMGSLYEIDQAIKSWVETNKSILGNDANALNNVDNLLGKLQQHQLNIIENFLKKIKPKFEKIREELEKTKKMHKESGKTTTEQMKQQETIKNFYDNLIQLVADKLDVLERSKEGLVNEIIGEQKQEASQKGGGSLKNNNVKQLHYFYKYIKYKSKCDNLLDEMK
jgi:hypothetical protein